MNSSSDAAFARTMQKTHEWLHAFATRLGVDDEQAAYRMFRGFLQTLRDRLTIDEAADLAAQLPVFLRGTFYEGWRPSQTPHTYHDQDTFLELVRQRAQPPDEVAVSTLARAAGGVLSDHITAGEYEHVMAQLPTPVATLLRN